MSFQVTLQPGGQQFAAAPDQTILDAALAAGLLIPHSCRDGACGVCKCKVRSGQTRLDRYVESALPPAEREAGYTLLCRAHACSDVVAEVQQVSRVGDIPVKKLPCRVSKLERLSEDVMRLELKLPASEDFRFLAGQYIDFLLPDGQRRSFSIANAPQDKGSLELHVRHIPGGRFTGQVFASMKEKDILRFEGPLGGFHLREDSPRPVILLAGGTGFAPIKSIVEAAIHEGSPRPMTLYWGARHRAGLYLHELAQSWEQRLPGFRYVPVLSEPESADAWTGRTGLVHHALMQDLPDLSGYEVYACGAPVMTEAARQDLSARCGLPEDAYFADAFTFSADTTARS